LKTPQAKNIVIIGDSFIALEMCGWLTTGLAGKQENEEDKKNVIVVMHSKAPMIREWQVDVNRACIVPVSGIFGQIIARAIQKIHEKNGATFYAETQITELTVSNLNSIACSIEILFSIQGENNVITHVQLATGESIPCDLAIVAIGSEPCTEMYKDSPIEIGNDQYIKVNERLETSVEHVLAIGDLSKYPLRVFNLDEVNCQHWQMACSSGHQAGRNIF